MSSDVDIYRSAQILIDEQGPGALSHATGRAAGFALEGDADQAKTWKRIVEAVRELQRLRRGEGEAVH